ncbi:MAG: metallophosphoesterase [Acidobacteria bacterium]|nr:metallophosphoesterase [Acidobacteriota bacterium]
MIRVLACGDVHGHFLLALGVAARWQQEAAFEWDAVLFAGDLGAFYDEQDLDSATRRHARSNPCELEFLRLWTQNPPSPLVDAVFADPGKGGLGLRCPILTVLGNHEGFSYIATLVPRSKPLEAVGVSDLPALDPGNRIRLLPSGWSVRLPSGLVISGLGGIQKGSRYAGYLSMAFIDDGAVENYVANAVRTDVLLAHEGPPAAFASGGAELLEWAARENPPQVYVHGHHVEREVPFILFPDKGKPLVVGVRDVAFKRRDGMPGSGWVVMEFDDPGIAPRMVMGAPEGILREFRLKRWRATRGGILVPPVLFQTAARAGIALAEWSLIRRQKRSGHTG